jgi:hypothetical protein
MTPASLRKRKYSQGRKLPRARNTANTTPTDVSEVFDDVRVRDPRRRCGGHDVAVDEKLNELPDVGEIGPHGGLATVACHEVRLERVDTLRKGSRQVRVRNVRSAHSADRRLVGASVISEPIGDRQSLNR